MAENYVLLEKIVVGAAGAASVTFANIPQTGYSDLVVKCSVRQGAGSGSRVQFNSDTSTANYQQRRIYGDGSSATSDSSTSLGYFAAVGFNSSAATANTFGNFELYIPNYTSSSNKSISADTVTEDNATTAFATFAAGTWSQTSAITSITLTPNTGSFVQFSTFYLYGVAKLGTTPAIAPKASGGDIIVNDGTYWYHTFLSSGTFTPQINLSCDVLLIAGGGGGRNYGGGGAGEVKLSSTTCNSNTAYTATVGAGGTGGDSGGAASDSTFNSITATKGLKSTTAYGAAGTSGNGFTGGLGQDASNPYLGGGGGGSSANGTAASSPNAGNGGAGLITYSTWASVTGTGVAGRYGGGGGGGGEGASAQRGTGGSGGGGDGSGPIGNPAGSAGIANTGSGGGGGDGGNTNAGFAGGSGLVIVRYAI